MTVLVWFIVQKIPNLQHLDHKNPTSFALLFLIPFFLKSFEICRGLLSIIEQYFKRFHWILWRLIKYGMVVDTCHVTWLATWHVSFPKRRWLILWRVLCCLTYKKSSANDHFLSFFFFFLISRDLLKWYQEGPENITEHTCSSHSNILHTSP